MQRVFGFPGQGSQVIGMGRGLFERFSTHTRAADTILGYSIEQLCLGTDTERLRQTQYTQPALFVVSALSYLDRAREDSTDPAFFIGHSLGEYVALFASGVFDFETGLRLVKRRGELMSRASGGSMAAVIGASRATVEEVLAAGQLTTLDLANLNTPLQTVLAGPSKDIARAQSLFEAHGARYVLLNVSAPFHSRYMRPAAEELRQELGHAHFRTMRVPVISNVSARPHQYESLRELLTRQLEAPVNFLDGIRFILQQGDFELEELGPGTVLQGICRQIRKEAPELSC